MLPPIYPPHRAVLRSRLLAHGREALLLLELEDDSAESEGKERRPSESRLHSGHGAVRALIRSARPCGFELP